MKSDINSNKIIKENRTARLTIMIDPIKKRAFEDICNALDTTPSQILRQMIRNFLQEHNVNWSNSDNLK